MHGTVSYAPASLSSGTSRITYQFSDTYHQYDKIIRDLRTVTALTLAASQLALGIT